MEIIRLTDSIVRFLFFSSVMLFLLGFLSCFVLRILKIQGKPKLLIYSLLVMMPLTYPIKTLLPDSIKVPIPIDKIHSLGFQPFKKNTSENSVSKGVSFLTTDRISANEVVTKEMKFVGGNIFSGNHKNQYAETGSKFPVDWKLITTLIWILVFLYFLIRLVTIIYNMNRFLKHADHVTNADILKLLRQCATETGLHRPPRLLMVDRIQAPMVMGFVKPGIILPKHLLKPEYREGLRFTLLHELKHVHRHHNWWLLIESLIGAAYFFHPVIHWAKKRIREELEHICDNHVIHITNKSASYADFLLHEIWQQKHERNPVLALPFISGVSKTTSRVRSILENTRPTMFTQIRGRIAVCLIFLSFSSLLLCSVAPSAHEPMQMLHKSNPLETDRKDSHPLQSGTVEMEKEVLQKDKFSTYMLKEQPSFDDTPDHLQAVSDDVRHDAYKEDAGTTTLQVEPTNKPVLESKSPVTVMADKRIQAEKIYEKQLASDPVHPVGEQDLSINTENSIVLVQNESAVLETQHEKHIGLPVKWLTCRLIKETRILNDQTILFIMYGGDLYLNRLKVPYPGLLIANGFSFKPFCDKITKFDPIRALYLSGDQIPGSPGILGSFYPYRYEGKKTEAIKLLKNGLLDELVAKGALG